MGSAIPVSRLVVTKQLNYAKRLHPDTVGQRVGPDMQGRVYTITEIVDRTDGKPGSTALLEWSAGA